MGTSKWLINNTCAAYNPGENSGFLMAIIMKIQEIISK